MNNKQSQISSETTRYVQLSKFQTVLRGSSANIAALAIVLFIVTLFATWLFPNSFNFYTSGNLAVLSQHIPIIVIMSIGAGILMISGEFDLSIAGVYTLCPFITASALNELGWHLFPSVLIGFVVALVIGFANGLVTTRLQVPSFIASLGMMFFLQGVVRWFSENPETGVPGSISLSPPEWFFNIMAGQILGPFYAQTLWCIFFGILAYLLLNLHTFGNHVFATGGDKDAAEKEGINTSKTKIIAFMICSFCAAFAGLTSSTRVNLISPGQTLSGLELQAIAACVIGGVYLFGGRGTVLGIVLGACLFGIVGNLLVIIRAPGEYMPVFIGFIVIFSVILNTNLGLAKNRKDL